MDLEPDPEKEQAVKRFKRQQEQSSAMSQYDDAEEIVD